MRKASEVLLSIENEIKQLNHYFSNFDMLLKALSNRVTAVEHLLKAALELDNSPSQIQTPHVQKPTPQKPVQMPGLKSSVIKGEDGSIGNVIGEESGQDYDFPSYEESLEQAKAPVGRRRDARYISTKAEEKKIPVQQQIVYASDEKNVCLASVEIFDSHNKLVSTCKTNNIGKWTQMLVPGKYTVSISKKPTTSKPALTTAYVIEVPKTNEPVLQSRIEI